MYSKADRFSMYRRRPVLLPAGPSLGPVRFVSRFFAVCGRGRRRAGWQRPPRSSEADAGPAARPGVTGWTDVRYRMVNWLRNRTMAARWCGRARTCRAKSSCRTPHRAISSTHSCGRIVDSIQLTARLASLWGSGGAASAARIPAPSIAPLRPAQCLRAIVWAIALASSAGVGAPCRAA